MPCPHCGSPQKAPPTAFSTVCKDCGAHIKVQDILKPKASRAVAVVERRGITCPDCSRTRGAGECGIDDVQAVQQSHRSAGLSNLERCVEKLPDERQIRHRTERICVQHGSECGRRGDQRPLFGQADRGANLDDLSSAEIKGTFTAGLLIIPAQNQFRWPQTLTVGSAEIAGELVADLIATNTVTLKSTGHMFGNAQARNLVVEPGAVLVGQLQWEELRRALPSWKP